MIIIYALKAGLIWSALFGLYWFVLRRETFFAANRFFLLLSLALGIVLPPAPWAEWFALPAEPVAAFEVIWQPVYSGIVIFAEKGEMPLWADITLGQIITTLYAIVVAFLLIRTGRDMRRIFQIRKKGKPAPQKGYSLIFSEEDHPPFSFGLWVFVSRNRQYNEQEYQTLLAHEKVHVLERHTLDLLFLEILSALFWWFPMDKWYGRALRDLHEYLADAAVVRHFPKKAYGQFLIRQATSGPSPVLAHPLIQSQVKKRITMMLRQRSRRTAAVKYLSALPILGLLVFTFSTGSVWAKLEENVLNTDLEDILPVADDRHPEENLLLHAETLVKGTNLDTIPQQLQKANLEGLPTDVIYYLDGQKTDQEIINKLDPSNIESINVLKGESAIQQYGAAAAAGVIEIYTKSKEEVFKIVEEMPRYPGCEDIADVTAQKACADRKMLEHLYREIRYPKSARQNGLQGTAVVSFIIEKDGRLTNIKAVRDPGEGLGAETERIIRTMPRWIPGKQRGRNVRVQYNLPVRFKLEDEPELKDEKWEESSFGDGLYVVGYKVSDAGQKPSENNTLKLNAKDGITVHTDKEGAKTDLKSALFFLNGKEITREEVSKLSENTFEKVNIYAGEEAVKRYGERGRKGVVEIFLNTDNAVEIAGKEKPLIVVDGKIVAVENIEEAAKPENIESVSILKGEAAIAAYGDQGKNGVVLIKTKKQKDENGVYRTLDNMPLFTGCDVNLPDAERKLCSDKKMLQFVYENIKYPAKAREAGIQGTVVVSFIIRKDGSVTDAEVKRPIDGGCSEEVMRVVKMMPKWTPGLVDGKAVDSYFTLPVKFKLSDDEIKKPAVAQQANSLEVGDFKIQPNPASDKVQLSFRLPAKPVTVTVYNIYGQQVYRKELPDFSGSQNLDMDLSSVAKGTLFVQLVQEGKQYTQQLVLQ